MLDSPRSFNAICKSRKTHIKLLFCFCRDGEAKMLQIE